VKICWKGGCGGLLGFGCSGLDRNDDDEDLFLEEEEEDKLRKKEECEADLVMVAGSDESFGSDKEEKNDSFCSLLFFSCLWLVLFRGFLVFLSSSRGCVDENAGDVAGEGWGVMEGR